MSAAEEVKCCKKISAGPFLVANAFYCREYYVAPEYFVTKKPFGRLCICSAHLLPNKPTFSFSNYKRNAFMMWLPTWMAYSKHIECTCYVLFMLCYDASMAHAVGCLKKRGFWFLSMSIAKCLEIVWKLCSLRLVRQATSVCKMFDGGGDICYNAPLERKSKFPTLSNQLILLTSSSRRAPLCVCQWLSSSLAPIQKYKSY